MRTQWRFCFLVLSLTILWVDIQGDESGDEGKRSSGHSLRAVRSIFRFPDQNENQGKQQAGGWKFQDGNEIGGLLKNLGIRNDSGVLHREAKSRESSDRDSHLALSNGSSSPVTVQRKSERKTEPDVQDIISGIVHLLGGKVNLHAANGAEVTAGQIRPAVPQSTRINNRGPPRVTEVPFEAIPLELGNSAGGRPTSTQQLPFGVPIRRPLWPPTVTNSGQNLQNLPFASGVPLPIQLVPPVANPAWPLPPAIPLHPLATESSSENSTVLIESPPSNESPQSEAHDLSAQHVVSEHSHSQTVNLNHDLSPALSSATSDSPLFNVPISSSNIFKEEIASFSFTADDASAVQVLPESSIIFPSSTVLMIPATTTSTSSLMAIQESSLLESILQSSIEDVTTILTESSTFAPSSPVPLLLSSVFVYTITSPPIRPSVAPTHLHPPLFVSSSIKAPQLEAAFAQYPNPSQEQPALTPPLPSSRPGQVFHESYQPVGDVDVITSDNIHPESSFGESFELVVTANQNFGGNGGQQATGQPYVIPVNIDEVRGQGGIVTSGSADTDQFVSIDGRKTYFNLFPTDILEEGTPSQVPIVQSTALPNRSPQVNIMGNGYVYPSNNNNPGIARPGSRPSNILSQQVSRPTPSLIRRPSTTPLSRIDACIVGDPNACPEPNETCKAEDDGAACNCKSGFGRKKSTDVCRPLTGLVISLKLDRLGDERLSWSSKYVDPQSPEYRQLQWECEQAVSSLMNSIPLTSPYISSSVNKFYSINNKVVVNVTLFLGQSSETQSVTYRSHIQKQMTNAIQQRNYNIGTSRLWADTVPIPAIQDLNECASADLNDCDTEAECVNMPGTYICRCPLGFSDPFVTDPMKSGRQCNSCTPGYCNNHGECRIENGQKTCQCRGNYQGPQCEYDGQVLGVAVGASVAAVMVIVLTLVFLCLWSRRWRQNQEKMERGGFMNHIKTMPFPAIMQDRIRWAQYAEAMASQNVYAQPIPPSYYYQPPPSRPASILHSPISPPPVPPRTKPPIRQAASLPADLVGSSLTSQMMDALQQVARRISRKKRPAPKPDPINVNPNLALIAPAYPVGTLTSPSRASMAPTLPLVGPFHRPRSTSGSVHSYGKRSAPPPPPTNPPPPLPVIETSEESAAESDAPMSRPFHVPRARSRSSNITQNNLYFDVDPPSNDFSSHSQLSLSTYNHRSGGRPYYH